MSYLKYTVNKLFTQHFLEGDFLKLFPDNRYVEVYAELKAIFDPITFAKYNENQLENNWITPVLNALGFIFERQVVKKVQGKTITPDFAFFATVEDKKAHLDVNKSDNTGILALGEIKAYHVPIDTNKVDKDNPHFQLMGYLQTLQVAVGFLTNGRYWRFYNTRQNRAEKVYFEIDLESIFKDDAIDAFAYFYNIFRAENFNTKIEVVENQLLQQNDAAKQALEADLKKVIYGEDSIIEQFGQLLYKRSLQDPPPTSLKDIYHNTIIFAFRLLFVAYFEDKFYKEFFEAHRFYNKKSLSRLVKEMIEKTEEYPNNAYNGWGELLEFFRLLNDGNENFNLALLNGGLFSPTNAPLLSKNMVINNQNLRDIFRKLFYWDAPTAKLINFRRDFKTLSVQHLGNIYEGLLEFEFRQSPDETIYYLVYTEANKKIEGYFDAYDYAHIKKNPKLRVDYEHKYASGEVYFSNQSNSRKTTASYYTPPEFTEFMAKAALEQALKANKPVHTLKILDNACGSGHFLIEILHQLTAHCYQNLDKPEYESLKTAFESEKASILENILDFLGADAQAPEMVEVAKNNLNQLAILKRILLKKTIFGLDLNPFAVELTRLSLWLDTFVVGTPLSFIEHHIKQGNALICSEVAPIISSLEGKGVFSFKVREKIQELSQKLSRISELKDNTESDIRHSKQIFAELQPTIQQLNDFLHLKTFETFVPFEYALDADTKKDFLSRLNTLFDSIEKDFFADALPAASIQLIQAAKALSAKYSFFNYEIEFAEVFANSQKRGFDIVIGNPPWDKTQFDEAEFFANYRSSYRTQTHSEKANTRTNLLEYAGIKEAYEKLKAFATHLNEYYRESYPYNRGAGNNNLFRFFVERNLSLLAPEGALTYLCPSAWSYEDSSLGLRKHILENYKLNFFYQFENSRPIFDRVHRSYKFATFQIEKADDLAVRLRSPTTVGDLVVGDLVGERSRTAIPTLFMQIDPKVLKNPNEQIIPYSLAQLRALSPEKWAFLEVKTNRDLEILTKAYQAYQPISEDYINFQIELNMTNDKGLFLEKGLANPLQDWVLYEGKSIHQYNPYFAEPTYWVNPNALQERLLSVETYRFSQEIHPQIPYLQRLEIEIKLKKKSKSAVVWEFFGISETDTAAQSKYLQFDFEYPRLAFRGISRNTDERTLISSILPAGATYGHSMFAHAPKNYLLNANGQVDICPIPIHRVLFVNALFNSLVVDYILRFMVDINVSKSYLMQLPIPQPADNELYTNPAYSKLIRNTALLTLSCGQSQGFAGIVQALQIQPAEIPSTDKRRDKLRAENDLLVKEIYGLTDAEFKHLSSPLYFKVLHDKPQQAGYLALLGW